MILYIATVAVIWTSYGEGSKCDNTYMWHFPCSDDSECYPAPIFCDGVKHCWDGSDEPAWRNSSITYDANTTFCRGPGQFHASNFGHRLEVTWICVLPPNLEQYKSELCYGTTCLHDEFPCSDGSQCIPKDRFCDTRIDCRDGSDEIYYNRSVAYSNTMTSCHGKNYYNSDENPLCMLSNKAKETIHCEELDCFKYEKMRCPDERCVSSRGFCGPRNDCQYSDDFNMPRPRKFSKEYPPDVTFCRERHMRPTIVHSVCVLPQELVPHRSVLCDGSTCKSDEFSCSDGSQCIPFRLFCNGKRDCSDGSDEPPLRRSTTKYDQNVTFCRGGQRFTTESRLICVLPSSLESQFGSLCQGSTCKSDEFECSGGSRCIPRRLFCNGVADCWDGSDEPPLRQSTTKYDQNVTFCRGGQRFTTESRLICVLPSSLESQIRSLCQGSTCKSDEFECLDGSRCIPRRLFCNGVADCKDRSDEPLRRKYGHKKYDHKSGLCRGKQGSFTCELPKSLMSQWGTLCADSRISLPNWGI